MENIATFPSGLNRIQILRRAAAILIGRAALDFFEAGSIVALCGKSAALCYFGNGKFGIGQKIQALFDTVLADKRKEGRADDFFEIPAALFW